jgi:hypothetical protein
MIDRRKVAWALWIPGTVLVIGSWVDVVPVTIGWIGFGVAIVGTLISTAGPTRPPAPRDDRPPEESTHF